MRVAVADRAVAARGPLPRRRRARRGAPPHQRDRRRHARGCPAGDAGAQPAHTELRAWAVSSTLTSLGRHNLTLPGDELDGTSVPGLHGGRTDPARSRLGAARRERPNDERALFSRQETLLATGARLFRAQGYPAVSTSEIGRGRGLRGPVCTARSRPNRPSSTRSSAASTSGGASRPFAHCAADRAPAECLRELVGGRVRISLDDPDLVSVSITELSHASSEVTRQLHEKREPTARRCGSTSSASWYPRPPPRRGATARRRGDQLHRRRRADMAPDPLRRSGG